MFGRFYYSFTVGENYFIVLDDANSKNKKEMVDLEL